MLICSIFIFVYYVIWSVQGIDNITIYNLFLYQILAILDIWRKSLQRSELLANYKANLSWFRV